MKILIGSLTSKKGTLSVRLEGVYIIKADSRVRFYPLEYLDGNSKNAFIQDLTDINSINAYFVFNNRAGSLDDNTVRLSDFTINSTKTTAAEIIINSSIFNVQTGKVTMPDGTAIENYIILSNKIAVPILSGYFNIVTITAGKKLPTGSVKIEFRDAVTDLVWDKVALINDTFSKDVVRIDIAATRVKVVILDVNNLVLDSSITVVPGETVTPTITGLMLGVMSGTVNVGGGYMLPVSATASMSDGTTKIVSLTWDKAVSTAAAGTYTFTGSTSGTALTVKFTLTVTEIVKTVDGLFV